MVAMSSTIANPRLRSSLALPTTLARESAATSSSAPVAPTAPAAAMTEPTPPPLSTTTTTTTTTTLPSAKRAAERERGAHARGLGCAASHDGIAAAELKAAVDVDGRVTAADFDRAVDRARRAQTLVPARQTVLSGFTRVIDAKLTLTPSLVSALCAAVGISAHDQLLAAIDAGPGNGAIAWPRPQGQIEFVASLVRQLVLGGGASLQLQVQPEHGAFLEAVVAAERAPLQQAMGGAGAFASNLLAALPTVRPRFFSAEPLPEKIAARFSERVEIVDKSGTAAAARKRSVDEPARVNFSCEYSAGQPLSVLGRDTLKINGTSTALAIGGSGRVILGTKAKDIVPGFDGVDDVAVKQMAKDADTFFFVGSHYLTQGSPAEAEASATKLARSLDVMREANPKLVRHLQYVVPKQASTEAVVMGALKGSCDSLSMNAVELPGLLCRLGAAGHTAVVVDEHQHRDLSEEPAGMLDGAVALTAAMSLGRVHLHGLYGDLIVVDDKGPAGAVDVDRTRLALLRARQLASIKAANDSGEITGAHDLFDVAPVVQGKCLAAVQRFADAVAARYGLNDSRPTRCSMAGASSRADVVKDWHFFDAATQQHVFFVPSRGIHDRTGGTVSLGDTIDISALVFSSTAERPKPHPRLAS